MYSGLYSRDIPPSQVFTFDPISLGFVGSDLGIYLSLISMVVGERGVDASRVEVFILTHDLFGAVTELVKDGDAMNRDPRPGRHTVCRAAPPACCR
jgi:hypothetical protein